MAEAPPAANRIESSTSKEEGELSSDVGGDADFHEAGSVSHSADCDAAPVKTVDSEALNKGTQDTKAVNKGTQATKVVNKGTQDTKADSLAVKSTSLTEASSKSFQQTNHHSNHEKTRVPFVISFSDDDSGSDSDDTRHDTSVGREHTQVAGTSRRPPVHKSQKAVVAKSTKASFSRAFVSGASRPSGTISRRGGQIRGHRNAVNFKKIAERSHSRRFNVHLNTTKKQLQDLRQLIADRESQLKAKPSQQTNITVPVKASSHLKRFCREASGDELQCHMTESNKKRLKTGELQTNRLDVDCRRNIQSVDQILTSGKRVENSDNSCKVVSRITSHHALLMPPNNDKKQSQTPCAISKEGSPIAFDSFVSNSNVKAAMPAPSSVNNNARGKKAVDNSEYSMREINCMNAPDEHMSMQNKCVYDKYLMEASHQDEVKAKVLLDDITRDSDFHAPDTGQQATMNSSCFLNGLDELSLLKCKNDDVKSLLDLEDLLDKELDEAQNHRRNCEIEERNALMAYRKAQRALAEASARCSHIYRKRELFSTQLRCRMMENPNLFFTTRDLDDIGVELNPNSISNYTMQPNPTSSHDMQAGLDNSNRQGHEFGFLTNASENLLEKHVDKQNLVSVEFCVPDDSSFKAHKECDRSIDVFQSDDDGEALHHRSLENSSGKSSDLNRGSERGINDVSERQVSSNDPQDSLLLEASLRSQLFEKLKMKKLAKRESQTTELVSTTRNEYDDGGIRMGTVRPNTPSPESRLGEQSNPEDVNKEEVSSMPLVQIMRPVEICRAESATPPVTDPMCCSFPFEGYQIKTPATMLPPTIKSAFLHMKVLQSLGLQQLPPTTTDTLVPDEDIEDVNQSVHDGHKKMTTGFITSEKTLQSLFVKQPGYYSCNFAIDASRPLCMFELRGKCNNDECSWQHIRDYACDNREHDTGDTIDYQVGKKPETDIYVNGMMSKSLTHLVLAPPTYVVGSDVLKHDSLHASTTAQSYGNCWQKCFSSFLVLSSLYPTVSISNEPFLHGTEARIEIHGGLTRQSSYFQSRNVTEADHYFEDVGQSLEVALHSFCKEANSSKQRLEALNVLARALETNQSSVALWIVYLLIYYSNQKSIGKDDLFQCAVDYNKESYEIWILFINSRVRLDDRLAAYQAALCALSSNKYASDEDSFLASQCILDILLQMMDNLCISGSVGKAIEKILGLFSSSKNSDDCIQLSTQDIIIPSELCDKVIFWVCCVYLIVYKKLPDPIVHSFECLKEPVVFDWPDVQLTSEEKLEASSLTELAVDSLVSCMDHESVETEKNLRAAHVFAINHVRCVSVLEGLDCSGKLLEKYVELYPSCVELVLMSARSEYHMSGTSFDGFEDALRNWPIEVPGKQCIWNQYFECALQSENTDILKELMDRWIQESDKAGLHPNDDDDGVRDLLQSASISDFCDRFSSDDQSDKVFGMLNFALYKRLHNDCPESRFALEHALKTTSADYYHHCLRELSLFILTDGIHHTWHDKVNSVLDILNVSLIDERVLSASQPLSRSFLQTIQKPTVRQLASKLLMPISANFYLMNTVLELWSGVLLLPEIQNKIMDLIDFIEAMMEVLPSNYLLAMSVCKQLKNGSVSVKSSPSISFWATSLFVNALFRAVPVAPEYCWVEAVDVLHNLACFDTIWESFHKKALSVYPFSIKLWRSYLRFSESAGRGESVKAEAQERGIEEDESSAYNNDNSAAEKWAFHGCFGMGPTPSQKKSYEAGSLRSANTVNAAATATNTCYAVVASNTENAAGPSATNAENAVVGDVAVGTNTNTENNNAAESLINSFGAGSYARRLLENMGWKEGEALGGKGTNGLLEPLQAIRNIGKSGLGWDQEKTKEFNSIRRIKQKKTGKGKGKGKGKGEGEAVGPKCTLKRICLPWLRKKHH